MKTDFQTKFLQHLLNKKDNAGFTLIELLVVIIIIGILSAIALPSFLNQANKARQSEAKTYVGSMNRAQQAYYLENAKFIIATTNFEQLALGVSTSTTNYNYLVVGTDAAKSATQHAETKTTSAATKAYLGGVSISQLAAGSNESSSLAVLCEGIKAPVNGGKSGAAADASNVKFASDAAPTCDGTNFKATGS
jgi:type IV pilus assembly protein PilA